MKRTVSTLLLSVVGTALAGIPMPAVAAPGIESALSPYVQDTGAFAVPPGLRKRVDFWKEVFTKYGRFQQIIHHREFPQIRFGIIDLTEEGISMHPVEFERFKKRETERRVEEVKRALKNLAAGESPSNLLEDIVFREMRVVRGGPEKYTRLIKEDLVRTQTGIKERYAEAVKRSGRYMHFMEEIFVRENGLPRELTRLPFVESSFDYTAYSSVGAAGIWQFMPRTAKAYKMKVSSTVDQRRDPIEATRAAAQYLKDAYSQLDSWSLAVTSYNHGVGGVRKRLRDYGTTDIVQLIEHPSARPFGFASSNFYPEFLAAVEIYRDWKRYFPDLKMDPPLHFTSQRIAHPVSAQHLARQLGMDIETLRAGNYALSETIWKGRYKIPAGYELRVPKASAELLARIRSEAPPAEAPPSVPATSSVYGGVMYTVRKGDTISTVARKYKVSSGDLKRWNELSSNNIRIGQQLMVSPKASAQSEKTVTASIKPQSASSAAKPSTLPKGMYKIQKGDTLFDIAKREKTTVDAIKRINRLRSNDLKVGETLIIP